MARFFVPENNINGDKVIITGSDVKHITRVLRLTPGEKIDVAAGAGKEFEVIIREITNKEVLCQIAAQRNVSTEPPVSLTLYQGLPKSDKMELVIQKVTEVGITRVVPVICERTVVKLDDKKASERQVRWQRIAEEAAKQSRRTAIPEVSAPISFTSAVSQINSDIFAIMPWEEHSANGLKEMLKPVSGKHIAVFIGPEGGFTRSEAELAKNKGIRLVSLGPRIMRTETAGIITVAIVLYELGDLGGADHG